MCAPSTQASSTGRIRLLVVFALALGLAILIGAYLWLVIDTDRRDADDRAAAASDLRLQRPLVSSAGRILFVAQDSATTDDFHVVNADGSGLARLTHLPQGTVHSGPPIVSPDRTRTAIGLGGVSIVRLDRPGETSRLDRPGGWLAWSPDGTQLASLSIDDAKRLHLYVFNADGSGELRDIARSWPSTAAGHRQWVSDLVWSPDARHFTFLLMTRPAYRAPGPNHNHIYIVLPDGSGLRNLSLDPKALPAGGGLAWSPDGRRLAFGGGRGIATVDVNLKWTDILVRPHRTGSSQQPAWSPDGTRLAWFNPDSIVISDPDGGRQQELTRGRCRGVHPSWSGDGLRIAFVCQDSHDRSNLFVMNADGSGLTQITNLGADKWVLEAGAHYHPKYPVWLPSPPPPVTHTGRSAE